MKTLVSRRLLNQTVAIAIASTSLLASLPTLAAPQVKAKPATTHTVAKVGNIVEVASSNPSFKTLVKAVKAAGLVDTLSGQGPFTVFAPTDAAFAALPKGTLEKLLKPENKETLTKILTYHVIPGAVYSKDIKRGAEKTVEGSPVNINIKNGQVFVSKARVIKADVKASNGVIHVINQVLIPPGLKP